MKKLFAILLISALLCALPALCEAGTGIPDELVGRWKGQGAPTYGGISSIDLTVTMNADGTGSGEYTYTQGRYQEDGQFTVSCGDGTFSVDNPADFQPNITNCEGTWALADGEMKLDITCDFESGVSYYYTAYCKKIDMSQDDAAEAYIQAEAGDPVCIGDLTLEPQLFTNAYTSWDLMTASTSNPFPAQGEVYMLRFAVAEGGEALTRERIENEIAPAMTLYAPDDGSGSRIFDVAMPEGDEIRAFDVLFYREEFKPLEDLRLLLDGVLYPLDGLPADGERIAALTHYEKALEVLNPLYEQAKTTRTGDEAAGSACAGKLIAAVYYSSSDTQPSLICADTEHFPVPDALKPYLAESIDEADVAALIFPTYYTVGYYSAGGAAEETTTWMTLFDLREGKQYGAIQIAVNQPPQTISVPVINGVTMSGGAHGTFEDEKALEKLVELAEAARAEPTPSPEATPEPTPEPTEEAAPEAAGEIPVDDVLSALGDDAYRATYDALLSGEVVQKGSKGDTAKGVQQTLVAFGQDIAVDGNVGPKTIAALNAVQAAFGLEETDSLDAGGYAALLPRLLIATDPDAADALLMGQMDAAEYDYTRACALVAHGKYASAKALFEESGWGDSQARAEACVQPWPKTGVLYKNPAVKGSSTELAVKFNTNPDTAMLVKIYTTDGVLARTMFIGGTGKATCSLPAGTYVIKDGTGHDWYGEEEAFGSDGYYEIMTFGDGEQEVQLQKNYRSTITVNVQDANPDAEGVGSDWESWSDF